jgi:hypothetical protein
MIAKRVISETVPLFNYYLSIAEDEKKSRMIILVQMTFSVMLAIGHEIIPHSQVTRG